MRLICKLSGGGNGGWARGVSIVTEMKRALSNTSLQLARFRADILTAGGEQGSSMDFAAPSQHVLVVDDDAGIRTLLVRILKESGFEATGVEDGKGLRDLLDQRPVDLILLDIGLPDENGLELCASLRETHSIPIIMISARGQEADRVAGLDIGADDYVAKPFGRSEVLARIRAVLRRTGPGRGAPATPAPESLTFDGWTYRPRKGELISPDGVEIELTGAEHELLLTLLRNPQRTIGRERLLELSRNRLAHASDRSVDVLVSRLRRKMNDGSVGRRMIHTIRGVGYKMSANVDAG